MTNHEHKAVKSLINNPEVVFKRAYKSGRVVVCAKRDYLNEGYRQLMTRPYIEVNEEYGDRVNTISNITCNTFDDIEEYKKLTVKSPLCGKFYLLLNDFQNQLVTCNDVIAQPVGTESDVNLSKNINTSISSESRVSGDLMYLSTLVNNIDERINNLEAELQKSPVSLRELQADSNQYQQSSPNEKGFIIIVKDHSKLNPFQKSRKIKTTVTNTIMQNNSILKTVGTSICENSTDYEDSSSREYLEIDKDKDIENRQIFLQRWSTFNAPGDSKYEELKNELDNSRRVQSHNDVQFDLMSADSIASNSNAEHNETNDFVNLLEGCTSCNLDNMQHKKRVIIVQMYQAEDSYVNALKRLVTRLFPSPVSQHYQTAYRKVRCSLDLHSSLGMLFVERKHSGAIAGKPHERPEATRQAPCHLLGLVSNYL
ncbi:hypothetical protein GJ496_000628 [Pomphorhynchus laevis]|nr:hypothetical protein GJ496_000628 [Pomphorhynchus laevis]